VLYTKVQQKLHNNVAFISLDNCFETRRKLIVAAYS
jgi:hypothetical protein